MSIMRLVKQKVQSINQFTRTITLARVVLWMSIFTVSGCSKLTETKSIKDIGHELDYHLETGDTSKAIEILEKYSLSNPESVELQVALIEFKTASGVVSKKESMDLLMDLQKKDSSNKWVRQQISLRIIDENSSQNALVEIEKMISENPTDFWNYLKKGRKLIELERYNEAIESFDIAIQLEPQNKYAYADRALAKYFLGDKAGACEDWKTPGGGAMVNYEKYCE